VATVELKGCPCCEELDDVELKVEINVHNGGIYYRIGCDECRFQTAADSRLSEVLKEWNSITLGHVREVGSFEVPEWLPEPEPISGSFVFHTCRALFPEAEPRKIGNIFVDDREKYPDKCQCGRPGFKNFSSFECSDPSCTIKKEG
jgi:hypothetical protein